MEADKTVHPAPIPASNSKDNGPQSIADESGDVGRLLATEVSRNRSAANVQSLSTLVSPLSPAAAHAPSPELQGTPPGPSESLDYYQVIGRAARSGDVGESIVCFNLESLCRRLRPGFFLDGIGVPCVMLPHAQPCNICAPQFRCEQPNQHLHHFPHAAAPPTLPSPDVKKQPALLSDPLEQPGPLGPSVTNPAAASPCLDFGKVGFSRAEEFIRTAGENLAKSCINCWSNGLEYHSHPLGECRWGPIELCSGKWREWRKTLRFPVGYCFYCGCPQKVCPDCICDCGLQF